MNTARSIGVILIVIGLIMTVITGFNVVTEKNVVNAGPIQIDKKENHPIYWSPVTGVVLIVGGILVIALGGGTKKTA
jgi:hypothetical protein